MSVVISPVGLAAAPVANVANIMATFKEKLCRAYCVDSTIGTARLIESTVFIPIQAVITIVTQTECCGCNAHTQLFTENFVVAFQGQTAVPTTITVANIGRDAFGSNIHCGKAYSYTINDSLTITIA